MIPWSRMLLSALLLLGMGMSAFAQSRQNVSGSVVDELGEPVLGANVVVKGATNIGTITDADGKFTLNVPENAVLVVSYIGYKTKEVVVGNQSHLDIVLPEDTQALEEVVVVGYGVQKKMNLSGAVSTVKMEDVLGDRPQPNVAAALQGAIPGLYITSGSNTPGQTGKSIQIRGTASFSGSNNTVSGISPLILIDNVPGDLDALNPEDIESVTVLKDASASAILRCARRSRRGPHHDQAPQAGPEGTRELQRKRGVGGRREPHQAGGHGRIHPSL